MKKRMICTISLSFAVILSLLLSSCGYKYEKFHTEENIMGETEISDKELSAYFFLLEEGGAVMDICNGEGELIQSLSFPKESEYYVSLDFDFAFEMAKFQDMNFDGLADLYVPCSTTTPNLEGMAWLWNSEAGEFVLSEELSALYELTVYPDEELITSQDYSDPASVLCKEFKWENGKLVQTGEYTVTY